MFITKMAISRRAVLRGIGATLSLPLLDSMIPALSAATAGLGTRTQGDASMISRSMAQ